jgi:hypothetical protein
MIKLADGNARAEVVLLVEKITKCIDDSGADWSKTMAALTICLGEMGEDLSDGEQEDFISYVAGVLSGMLHVRNCIGKPH